MGEGEFNKKSEIIERTNVEKISETEKREQDLRSQEMASFEAECQRLRNVAVGQAETGDDLAFMPNKFLESLDSKESELPTVEEINSHDWKKELDGKLLVFWSGGEGKARSSAEEFVNERRLEKPDSIEALTISDTDLGRQIEQSQERGLLSREKADELWKAASAKYAEAAEQNLQKYNITPLGFVENAVEGRDFEKIEHPRMTGFFSDQPLKADESPSDTRFDKFSSHPRDEHGKEIPH